MPAPSGFTFSERGASVAISRHGRVVTILRADTATRFLHEIERSDPQLLMARVTGNYRRGNEREARKHERNSG